jgi:hypothetical protein
MTSGSVHTVHFTPEPDLPGMPARRRRESILTKPNIDACKLADAPAPEPRPHVNQLDLTAALGRDIGRMLEMYRGIVGAANRQGDLRAMLTACLNAKKNIEALLEAEEI